MIEVKFVVRGSIYSDLSWSGCCDGGPLRQERSDIEEVDMKRLSPILALAFVFMPAIALAQNDAHHEGGAANEPSPPATTSMPQQCMSMMQMMDGMMGEQMSACMAAMPPASQAYMRAMMGMHTPMMEAMRATDPDVGFVKGMIPHHQAAIDMARAVLQFGTDQQTRAWAEKIIAAQQAEIDEMQEWLRRRGQ